MASTSGNRQLSRDAGRSRRAILEAAERVFARDGWREATLAAIGAEAGVSRGTPGYFFRSKDGLFAAMAERLVADARAAAAEAPGHAADRAVSLLVRQLEFVARRPALARLAVSHWSSVRMTDAGHIGALEADLIRQIAELLESVPGARRRVDSAGVAAMLLVSVWTAGLPAAPSGSVSRGPAAVADGAALIRALVDLVLKDSDLTQAAEGQHDPSLSSSKSRPWRLPGVN